MTRLTREVMDAYDARVDAVADAAGEAAVRAFDALRARSLNASVAEVREQVILVVESTLSVYGAAAAEVAAELYDDMADQAGSNVPAAELAEAGDDAAEAIGRWARFAVRELADLDREREDI